MIKYIFLKELQNYLLTRSILFMHVVVIILFVLNASIHVFRYQDVNQIYDNNVAKNYQNLIYDEEQNVRTLPSMISLQQKIYKQPPSLSFISSTTEGLVPDGASMKMLEEPDFENFEQYNPYMNPYLSIDWTTLIIYVVSFLCICFSYNAFSGEREDSTLKLMLANSVSRSSIISGKYLGLLVIFVIPILIGILMSCLIFEISTIHLELADYAKIGWFFLVSVLMVSFTIMLGFLVSLLNKSSYVSLIICLLCWTLLVIIIPNSSWIVCSLFNKIPEVTYIYTEEEQQINALEDCYLGWLGDNSTEQHAIDRKSCIDRRTAIHNSLWSNYHDMQIEQINQAIKLSKISPFGLFRFLSDKVASNNFYGYVDFFKQVKNYKLTYENYVVSKDNADQESRHLFWNDPTFFYEGFMSRQQIVPSEVPQFVAQSKTFRELVVESLEEVAILCFWVIGLFIFSFIAFIRYDVR